MDLWGPPGITPEHISALYGPQTKIYIYIYTYMYMYVYIIFHEQSIFPLTFYFLQQWSKNSGLNIKYTPLSPNTLWLSMMLSYSFMGHDILPLLYWSHTWLCLGATSAVLEKRRVGRGHAELGNRALLTVGKRSISCASSQVMCSADFSPLHSLVGNWWAGPGVTHPHLILKEALYLGSHVYTIVGSVV